MKRIRIKKGYDIPIKGAAHKTGSSELFTSYSALNPSEYPLIKPKVIVRKGQNVRAGDIIFHDKKREYLKFTSFSSGIIEDIVLGERRAVKRVVIRNDHKYIFKTFPVNRPEKQSGKDIADLLCESGMWNFIRRFPENIIADPSEKPAAVYINAFITEPWLPDMGYILEGRNNEFHAGLEALKKIVDVPYYITTKRSDPSLPGYLSPVFGVEKLEIEGGYPSCHPGVACYYNTPLKRGEYIWFLSAYEISLIGEFVKSGKIPAKRAITLCGDPVSSPRYLEVNAGASIEEIINGPVADTKDLRFISGGVFTGSGGGPGGFLGFYDLSIFVIKENTERKLLNFLKPRFGDHSMSRTFPAFMLPYSDYVPDTGIHGEKRACVQCNQCDSVCPVDIYPGYLYRNLQGGEIEDAEKLGLFDCVECGLCSYACVSKIELTASFSEFKKKLFLEENAL